MTFAVAAAVSLLTAVPVGLLGAFIILPEAGWSQWWQLAVMLLFSCGWPFVLAWIRGAREARETAGKPGSRVLDIFGGPGPLTPATAFGAVAAMSALMGLGLGCAVLIDRFGGHPMTMAVVAGSCMILAMVASFRLQGYTMDEPGEGAMPGTFSRIVIFAGWTGTLGRSQYALRLMIWHSVQVACELWVLKPHDPISIIGSAEPVAVVLGLVMLVAGWSRTAAGVRRSRDVDLHGSGAFLVVIVWLMELVGRSTLKWQSLLVQFALLVLPSRSRRGAAA